MVEGNNKFTEEELEKIAEQEREIEEFKKLKPLDIKKDLGPFKGKDDKGKPVTINQSLKDNFSMDLRSISNKRMLIEEFIKAHPVYYDGKEK